MIFFYGILFIIAVTFLWVISTNEYAQLVQKKVAAKGVCFGLVAGLDEYF